MSKIITDEQELNTATGELVTEDYALEILGLQSIADFRKFSRSFMKLSKIVKKIENSDNNKSEKGHLHDDRYYTEAEVNNELAKKLNKGTVSSEYDTAKKIEDKIKEAKKSGDNAGAEANKKLDKGNVIEKYNTAEKIGNEVDKKYDKTGGTISENVVVQGNEIVNGSVSCNSLILNGYTITIE